MGYTPTGTTFSLSVYLTDVGRKDLVNGNGFNIKFFALGDTDIAYTDLSGDNIDMPARTTDLRGSTDNCFSVTARKTIKSFINKEPNTGS
jgi:hypothetical protein